MAGTVTLDDIPVVMLPVAGKSWMAIIDTGFNGDLELPELLRTHFSPRSRGEVVSALAAGQLVTERVLSHRIPI